MNRTTTVLALVALAFAGAPAAAQTTTVYLHDTPSLHIAPETLQGTVGETLDLRVEVPADQQGTHDFAIPDLGIKTALLSPGQSVPVSVALDRAGTFEYYCTVPGHKEGGMVGTLVVQSAASADVGANESPLAAALAVLALAGLALVLRVKRA